MLRGRTPVPRPLTDDAGRALLFSRLLRRTSVRKDNGAWPSRSFTSWSMTSTAVTPRRPSSSPSTAFSTRSTSRRTTPTNCGTLFAPYVGAGTQGRPGRRRRRRPGGARARRRHRRPGAEQGDPGLGQEGRQGHLRPGPHPAGRSWTSSTPRGPAAEPRSHGYEGSAAPSGAAGPSPFRSPFGPGARHSLRTVIHRGWTALSTACGRRWGPRERCGFRCARTRTG